MPFYYCTECEKFFNHKCFLKVHQLIHTGERPFVCPECKKSYNTKGNLLRHQRTHGDTDPKRERRFPCTDCKKDFSQKCLLKLHQRIHTGERPFVCSYCEKSFAQKGNFQRHEKIHTDTNPERKSNLSFTPGFNLTEKQLNHQINHTREIPRSSAEREQSFTQENCLRSHQGVQSRPHACTECEKSFYQSAQLIRHLKVHSGDKPFSCTECENCFSQKVHLERHQRTHTKKRPFTCSYCEKSFNRKDNFQIHQKTHIKALSKIVNKRCFSCKQCGESFHLRKYLLCHQIVHTRPHSGTESEQSFGLESQLIKHESVHPSPHQLGDCTPKRERSCTGDMHSKLTQTSQEEVKSEKEDDSEYLKPDMGINWDRRKQMHPMRRIIYAEIQANINNPTQG